MIVVKYDFRNVDDGIQFYKVTCNKWTMFMNDDNREHMIPDIVCESDSHPSIPENVEV